MEEIAVFRELKISQAKVHLFDCEIKRLKSELKNAWNELCLKCGNYHRSHEGACNGCRYRHGGEWEQDIEVYYE